MADAQAELEKHGKGSGKLIEQNAPTADFAKTPGGREVYDQGETVVNRMNREHARLDKDTFFQELFENYLVSVERHEPRQLPDSRIITYWDMSTCFDDFLSDSLKKMEKDLEALKLAKAVGTTRFSAIGDSVLGDSKFKMDAGSAVAGKSINAEDYDAIQEILRWNIEAIQSYKAGRISVICNAQTGRVRVGGSTVN